MGVGVEVPVALDEPEDPCPDDEDPLPAVPVPVPVVPVPLFPLFRCLFPLFRFQFQFRSPHQSIVDPSPKASDTTAEQPGEYQPTPRYRTRR